MSEKKLLIKECEIISNRILSVWLNSVRIVVIGTTLLIGLLGLAYKGIGLESKETMKEILVLLPIGFFFLLYYVIYLFAEVNALGGYKKFIEEKLNENAGCDIFLWESKVSPIMRRCAATIILFAYIGLLGVASVYIGFHSVPDGSKTLYLLFISFLTIGLVISFVSMIKKYDDTYRLATSIEAARPEKNCQNPK